MCVNSCTKYFRHGVIGCRKFNLIWSLRESKRSLAEISTYVSFPWGFLCFRDLSSHIRANAMLQNLLGNGTSNTNLYVAGLPPSTSEEMMRQLFKEFGDVSRYEGKMCRFCWDHQSWAYCAKHLASMGERWDTLLVTLALAIYISAFVCHSVPSQICQDSIVVV